MNCERCRELFPETIGEELHPRLAGELRQHLAGCADCRKELELLGRTASVLKAAWPEEAIPEPLTFGRPGRAAVAGGLGSFWRQPPRMAWLGLAAAACLVVCLGTLSFLNARVADRPGKLQPLLRTRAPAAGPATSGLPRRFRGLPRGPAPPPGGPGDRPTGADLGGQAPAGRGPRPVPVERAAVDRSPAGQRRPELFAEASAGHAPGDGPQRGADRLGGRPLPPPSRRCGCPIDPAAARGNPRSSL